MLLFVDQLPFALVLQINFRDSVSRVLRRQLIEELFKAKKTVKSLQVLVD